MVQCSIVGPCIGMRTVLGLVTLFSYELAEQLIHLAVRFFFFRSGFAYGRLYLLRFKDATECRSCGV